MPDKKTIIDRLLEEEQLQKFAQVEPVVNEAAINKEANDIFDQLFEQALKEMGLN